MSIPVSFDQLADLFTHYPCATLITLREGTFVKIMTVDPVLRANRIVVPDARKSVLLNAAADPHVTLILQPAQPHGWTLIVDGLGKVVLDNLEIEMVSGMLHRPRSHSDGPNPPLTTAASATAGPSWPTGRPEERRK